MLTHADAQIHVPAPDVAVILLRERVEDGPDAAVLLGASRTAPLHQRPNPEDRVRLLRHRPAHTDHLAVRDRQPHQRDLPVQKCVQNLNFVYNTVYVPV